MKDNKIFSMRAKAIAFVISLILIMIISEIAVRLFFPAIDPFVNKNRPLLHVIRSWNKEYWPGIYSTSTFSTDKLGFRTAHDINYENKPSNVKRIVFIGGSVVEEGYLDDQKTFPVLFEKRFNDSHKNLKVETINTARSGLTSVDHYRMAKEIMKYNPDFVVFLMGANDLRGALGHTENKQITSPELSADHENRNKFFVFLTQSHIVRHIILARAIVKGHLRGDVIANNGTEALKIQAEAKNRKEIRMTDAIKNPHYSYQRNIELIAELFKNSPTQAVFITQPSLWAANLPEEYKKVLWMTSTAKEWAPFRYAPEDLAESLERYNDVVRFEANKYNIDLIDLSKLLPKNTTIFHDDMHFNHSGAEKVADILTTYFSKTID